MVPAYGLLKKILFFRVREFQNCWENSWTPCSEDACLFVFFFAPRESTREDAQDEPKRYNSRSLENSVFFSEPMNFDPRLKKGFFLGATLNTNLKVISWLPFYDYYDLNKSKSVTNNGAIFSDIWFQCDFFPPFYPHKSDILEDRTEQIATVPNNAQSS